MVQAQNSNNNLRGGKSHIRYGLTLFDTKKSTLCVVSLFVPLFLGVDPAMKGQIVCAGADMFSPGGLYGDDDGVEQSLGSQKFILLTTDMFDVLHR